MNSENTHKTWVTIAEGDKASFSLIITENMVKNFAELTGDNNPIHTDEEFAKKTIFRKRIVHGAFQNSLISALLATKLPGPGSIYCSQQSIFTAALFIGDTITVEAEVVEKILVTKQVKIKTTCKNQNMQTTLEGFAIVYPARK